MEKRSRKQEEEAEAEAALDFENETHNNLDSSFSPSDSDHNFSSNFYATDSDYDDESHSPSKILQLDDNGFPSSHLPPGLKHHDDIEFDTNRSTQIEQGTDCRSFASDFYSCGTDCSSLLLYEEENDSQKKKMDIDPKAMRKLKQTNLFQMWGARDKLPDCEADDKGSGSSIRYPNNKKMKGLLSDGSSNTTNDNKKNAFLHLRNSSSSSSSSIGAKSKSTGRVASGRTTVASNSGGVADRQRPRVCPFYKKIPGSLSLGSYIFFPCL